MIHSRHICGMLLAVVGLVCGCAPLESRDAETDPRDAPADTVADVRIVEAIGGDRSLTYAVDVHDTIAVFGRGTNVVIVDVSDPSRPAEIGSVSLPGEIRDVAVRGTNVYAAADSGGLHIIDLSEPNTPAATGSIRFKDLAYGVDLDGDYVYVAARSEGLRVIDVTDPATPVEAAYFSTPDEAVDVVVRDGFAYIAAWYESMRVVDIRDPAALEEVSYASYDSYDNGAAWSVHVDGEIGLAAVPEMGLRTVDISDPRDVKLYRVYRGLFAPAGAAVRGRTAFVADQSAGLRVLDLADPREPVEIGSVKLPGRSMAVSLQGDIAYVAAREGGLRVVDISRPYDPHEIAYVDAADVIVDVSVAGDTLAAVGSQNGVNLHRASADWSKGAAIATPAQRVIFHGNRLLTAGTGGVSLYDRSNPTSAIVTSNMAGTPHGLAASGDIVAVAVEEFGVRFLAIGTPGDLREVGSFEPDRAGMASSDRHQVLRTPPSAWDVVISEDLGFAAFDDGVRVIDISDPARPALVALHALPERAYRLLLRDSRLYVACDDGLRVIDVSDPERPAEVAHVKTPSFATALALDGDRVYVGDLSGVLTVTSTSEPMERIHEVKIADQILGLALVDTGIAAAVGEQGVRVVAVP